MSLRKKNEVGFTLIEVLAALLIFSLSIVTLTQVGAQSTRTVIALQDKMLAGVIADNQLVLARVSVLELGVKTGEEIQNSQVYNYDVETSTTELNGLFRITVSVRNVGSDQVLVRRTAYKARP